jgi:alpha-mannosidase
MTKIETIYFIHHSHTDVGYTQDQPIVWEMHTRFIDEALNLAEKYAESNSDGAFRWTVETTVVLQQWLATASQDDIRRFIALEKAGRVEVTGMFANLTPLLDTDQVIESFQILRKLREDYGFNIRHAMNCDVNGENWSLTDVLLDLGIEGFTMAINTHFGGALQPRPHIFNWQAPSGRTLPTFNGWTYDKGWREGIGRDAEDLANVRFPRLQKYLDEIGYPLPIIMLQSYHPYGDNGSAFDFTPFIDAWNAAGNSPRIIMATPSTWWNAVKQYQLETLRGDWTDYWNFGAVSSARETTINRASRVRLRAADSLYAVVNTLPSTSNSWSKKSFARHREQAWKSLHLWDEHTWGADTSIRNPPGEDTFTQWNHKAHYAYEARSLSLLLQRDALADFAQHVARQNADDLLVYNPLPWARTISGAVPYFATSPRGVVSDTTAGRQHQDRDATPDFMLPPTTVPGYGYTVVSRASLLDATATTVTDEAVVENQRYRTTFDREKGGITSLYDKQLEYEWVDQSAGYGLNGYVHEMVADTEHEWARKLLFEQDWSAPVPEIIPKWKTGWEAVRSTPTKVTSHKVTHTPTGIRVTQELDAQGCNGTLVQSVFLPNYADRIECESHWDMTLTTHPEATYLMFPFNLPDATARFDIGGQAIEAGEDQLPDVARDYFTAQGWVDFAGNGRGMTVAVPENPMVQLGGFHFGDYQMKFTLDKAMLLGWVTNNYWETNFRAHQPGRVVARYVFQPYSGGFDESRAHQFGLEAANSAPVVQHLGEAPAENIALPASGSLLDLPDAPVLTLHVKAARDGGGMIVRLLNASDAAQTATIGSSLLKIASAKQCDLLENVEAALNVQGGAVTVGIPARGIRSVLLTFA